WARVWREFADRGKPFSAAAFTPGFLPGYLVYYFTTNVGKVQLVLLALARRGLLPQDLVVVDVGVGTATTAVAVLDFLLAWSNVCDLFGRPFPVRSVRLLGLDANWHATEYSARVVEAYGEALAAAVPAANGDVISRLATAAARAEWRLVDLNTAAPSLE